MSPEALARLRNPRQLHNNYDGVVVSAPDLRALLDAYDTAIAQVDAARATCLRFGANPERAMPLLVSAVLRAMDEAKAGRR